MIVCTLSANDDMGMDYKTSSLASTIFHTRTHLGGVLQPGDSALDCFLSNRSFDSYAFTTLLAHCIPDVVLVCKPTPIGTHRANRTNGSSGA